MSETSDDQTHVATPARIQQARSEGDIPKSFELASAFQMLGALLVAYLLFGQLGTWLRTFTTDTWSTAGSKLSVNNADVTGQIQNISTSMLTVLAPIFLMLLLLGVAAHWLQTGPVFLPNKVAPDVTRLGAGNWRRQFFSVGTWAHLLVGVPKTLMAFVILGFSVWFQRNHFLVLPNYPFDVMVQRMFTLIMMVTFHVALGLLFLSAADYWLKHIGHQRRLKMTDQQLRDELRMQNGDPQIRARQRKIRQS
ncbi:MAG: EscU/YscU/HrcU family type III secretion system export apparatus switch protein [Mariniblastus sp.]